MNDRNALIWLAITSPTHGDTLTLSDAAPPAVERGTLVFETVAAPLRREATPILHASDRACGAILSLSSLYDGCLHFLHRRGADCVKVAVGPFGPDEIGPLRVQYTWDVQRGQALFTAENLATGTIRQRSLGQPLALTRDEIAALTLSAQIMPAAQTWISWIGIAAGRLPVGGGGFMAGSTPVLTLKGPRRLRDVRPDDLVETIGDGLLPVRRSVSVEVPALGSYRPVRLLAPFFAQSTDLVVTPDHRVAMFGPDVEYLFETDCAFVQAERLVDGRSAVWHDSGPTMTWHGLLFDSHQVVDVDGQGLETLFIGRLGQTPDIAETTVFAGRKTVPELPFHRKRFRRDLDRGETAALLALRASRRSPYAA
jgi:hypothetical protein